MENPDGLPLGHGGDFEIDADHASPEVKEIVSEDDPEVFFSFCRLEIKIVCLCTSGLLRRNEQKKDIHKTKFNCFM